ncbi:hypothetical protein JG687_00019038 [Phytophthora cactorum]|uniref:Uncharacterized protein n=1 Tax=Phytophthora cactorum TaxID=29920 RepID=A0A8T1TL82_9STRA|nr:hypothetical protein GQ600_9303 [Phytophthora cactorum]KAF1787364.1 hypothetical protein GQ600_6087 [Phytophthora cactorum]KAG6942471.1 hypothetical protein JG687_00019038 [Phytophthora cactorum]
MAAGAPPSPVEATLTRVMKTYIDTKLDDTPSMMAQLVFSFLCLEIREQHLSGPVPELEKCKIM